MPSRWRKISHDTEFDSMYGLTRDEVSNKGLHKSSREAAAREARLRAQVRRLQSEKDFHVKKNSDQGRLICKLSDASQPQVADLADMRAQLQRLREDLKREKHARLHKASLETDLRAKKVAEQHGRLVHKLSNVQDELQRGKRARLSAESSCNKQKLAHAKNIAFQKHQIDTLRIQNASKTEHIKAMRKETKRAIWKRDEEKQRIQLKYEMALFWDSD